MKTRIEYYCDECDGTNVSVQGWLKWNIEKQKWNILSVGEDDLYDYCEDCKDETKVYEREMSE